MILKPINSFKSRTGVDTKFDMGDVVEDSDGNIAVVRDITSMSDGAYYTFWSKFEGPKFIEYKDFNKRFFLKKKADKKIQYLISTDAYTPEIYDIANGLIDQYPEWFEKEYNKL